MIVLEKFFNWMLVIGIILMIGRIVTAVLLYLDIPFTTFFKDYSLLSFIILIIGVIGTEAMKKKRN